MHHKALKTSINFVEAPAIEYIVKLDPIDIGIVKSFMQVLQNLHHTSGPAFFDTHMEYPKPCLKGDVLAIQIFKDEYRTGIAGCKNVLH